MKISIVLAGLALVSACHIHDAVLVTGEMDTPMVSTQPSALDVVVVYSPEQGDHEAVGTTVHGAFPAAFTLEVPGPPWGAFEDRDGFELAAGSIWIAREGTSGTRDDGFRDGELIDLSNYVLLYLTDDPGSDTPFLVSGLTEGWNLIHRVPLDCSDKVDLGGGAFTYNFRYELIPIDSVLSVQMGVNHWDTLDCR